MDLSTREGRRLQGARIKEAAREAGQTLDELARTIGCSRALIFQYASGASLPQTDRLQQIALAVGRPLYWFFLDENEPTETVVAKSAPDTEQVSSERSKLELEREQFALERALTEQR